MFFFRSENIMPQKKRGHGWSKRKCKRKCTCVFRQPKPKYHRPLSVRDWKSICYKSLRSVNQCYIHGRIRQKYDQKIKNYLRVLSTLDSDSIPSPVLFQELVYLLFYVNAIFQI